MKRTGKAKATVTNFNVMENGIHKHIARIPYHGKNVHGYAYCDPDDTYNPTFGDQLATLRCQEKLVNKKLSFANSRIASLEKKYQQTLIENEARLNHIQKAMRKTLNRVNELREDKYMITEKLAKLSNN